MTNRTGSSDTRSVSKNENEGAFDQEMEIILRDMLEKNEDITARGVIRRHSKLKAASSITRSKARSELLEKYKERQEEFRRWHKRLGKRSKGDIAIDMADKDIRIVELESQVELLTVSHVAMIRAVGELGGFSKWTKFFSDYSNVRTKLAKMGALPDAAITPIKE